MSRRPIFPSDFRALFRALAHAAVASSFAASGCYAAKSTRYEPAVDAAVPWMGDWVPLTCAENVWPLEEANLERAIDYLGSYRADWQCASDPFFEPNRSEHQLYGTPCAAASDRDACMSLVRQHVAEDCSESCPDILIATAGDEVIRYEGQAGLAELLGPVDSEVDAALAAYWAGALVTCAPPGSDPEAPGTRVRAVEHGYELETRWVRSGASVPSGTAKTTVSESGVVFKVSWPRDDLYSDGICGRCPAGLLPPAPRSASSEIGAYLASCAHLEAASVFAFEQLAHDLGRLGAPRGLIERSLRAARDEIQHARVMESLASRFGGERVTAHVLPQGERGMLAIAIENATEGCVRETYGAVLACYQAQVAGDSQVRAVMVQIAEDETRHAELSWHIAAWLEPLLSERERTQVAEHRRAALTDLRRELAQGSPLPLGAQGLVGLPAPAKALALLAQLDLSLALSSV